MKIIPSLFIQNGRAVSLYKGKANDQKKTYPKKPIHLVERFIRQGAMQLQLIDLDGRVDGQRVNAKALHSIVRSVNVPVTIGGQIRTLEEIEELFQWGAAQVILGVSARALIPEALGHWGSDRIVFGIKSRRQWVESEALSENSDEVLEIAEQMVAQGVKQIIVNDMERQGTLMHPNYDDVDRLITLLGEEIQIHASGGVAALDDFRILKTINAAGVVASRAFIEQTISLEEAVNRYDSF